MSIYHNIEMEKKLVQYLIIPSLFLMDNTRQFVLNVQYTHREWKNNDYLALATGHAFFT
jgi:hypothetical protein